MVLSSLGGEGQAFHFLRSRCRLLLKNKHWAAMLENRSCCSKIWGLWTAFEPHIDSQGDCVFVLNAYKHEKSCLFLFLFWKSLDHFQLLQLTMLAISIQPPNYEHVQKHTTIKTNVKIKSNCVETRCWLDFSFIVLYMHTLYIYIYSIYIHIY